MSDDDTMLIRLRRDLAEREEKLLNSQDWKIMMALRDAIWTYENTKTPSPKGSVPIRGSGASAKADLGDFVQRVDKEEGATDNIQ